MGTPEPASIVMIPFPYTDLSASKLRPALILADAGRGDWVMCQITSVTHGDPHAIAIVKEDYERGSLATASVIRPLKLFTGSQTIMTRRIAVLKDESFRRILTTIITLLNA